MALQACVLIAREGQGRTGGAGGGAGAMGPVGAASMAAGVRRFFVRDPNGRVVNVVSHR